MFKSTYKIICIITFVSVFLVFIGDAGGQKPPKEVRDTRDRERKEERSTVDKKSKWTKELRKESLKVTERKMVDRNPSPRGGKPVQKAEKWSRGDLKKKFNDAANPLPNLPAKKDGGKTGGDGNPGLKPPPPVFKPRGM